MKDEKILENEILNDEELEQVAGGTAEQTRGDSVFLKKFGIAPAYRPGDYSSYNDVRARWKSLGIYCSANSHCIYGNQYLLGIDEKPISRKEAFQIALKARGWNQVAIDCFDYSDYEGGFD